MVRGGAVLTILGYRADLRHGRAPVGSGADRAAQLTGRHYATVSKQLPVARKATAAVFLIPDDFYNGVEGAIQLRCDRAGRILTRSRREAHVKRQAAERI